LIDPAIERFFNIARKLPVPQRRILLALYELHLRARLDEQSAALGKGILALHAVLKRLSRGGYTKWDYKVLDATRLLRRETRRRDDAEAHKEASREMGAAAWGANRRPPDEKFLIAWNEATGKGTQRAKAVAKKLGGSWEGHYKHSQRLRKAGLLKQSPHSS
jgi:hypothetical protein